MRKTILALTMGLTLFACTKDVDPPVTEPVVDNGPIGGTYTLSAVTTKNYDTIPGSGIVTINEYSTTTTNLKGTLVVTATGMTSKGLMYDYTLNGTKKEVNTANGNTVTTDYTPATGSRGAATTTYSSNYTINAAAKTVTVADAQYLFNPAFLLLPASKIHSYAVSGNTIKFTSEYYDASNKGRVVNEATFTKQ